MPTVSKIAVIGAGTMGHGIAQVAAAAGYSVALHDSFPGALDKGRAGIEKNLDVGVQKGKVTPEARAQALSRITFAPDLEPAVRDADLVIEAILEDLAKKKDLFARLDQAAPARAVLATNTSSLPVAKIAEAVRDPGRVVGMHFFNPVHLMKLLEIVVHGSTSPAARETAEAVGLAMGKTSILVKDSPGFASSRLGVVLGLEAMRMVEQGVASPQDIDKAMELGYGHPMGPLRLTDLVGLDVRLAIAEHLHRELKDDTYRPPELLRKMVAEGRLGKKSKRGFYDWEGA